MSVLPKSVRNNFSANELAISTNANQSHAQYNSTLGKHFKMQSGVKTCIFQNPNPLNPINLSSLNTHARDSGLRIHLPSQLPIRLKLSNWLENSLQLTIKLLLNPYVWRRTIRDSVLETFPPLFKVLFGFDILKGVRDYFFLAI